MFFQRRSVIFWRVMLFLWVVLVGISSLIRIPRGGPEGSDKLAHLVVYFLTAGLYFFAFRDGRFGRPIPAFLVVFGYSGLLEWLQYYLPWRSFSLGDLAANLGGVILGIALSVRLGRAGVAEERD
jgi:VanZ family protein